MSLGDIQSQQEDQIRKSYAQMRLQRASQQDAARQQLSEDLNRQEGQVGGFGGAGVKLRENALTNLNTGFAADETGAGAQESQQLANLNAQKAAMAYGTQERLGSEAFQGQQAGLTRAQQAEQFGQTLGEQKRQFSLEFDENKVTNGVNAAIALKDAGLANAGDWSHMWGGLWQNVYGSNPAFSSFIQSLPDQNHMYGYQNYTPTGSGTYQPT